MTANAERVLPYATLLARGLQMPVVLVAVVMQAPDSVEMNPIRSDSQDWVPSPEGSALRSSAAC